MADKIQDSLHGSEESNSLPTVFALLFARGVSAAALGFGSVLAARTLGPDRQGMLVLLLTLAVLLAIACSFGTNVVARRLLVGPEPQLLLGDYLSLSAILATLEVVLILGGGSLLVSHVHVGDFDAVVAAAFYGAMLLVSMLLLDALNADGQLVASGVIDATGSLLQLLAVISLALARAVTPTFLLWAYGGALLVELVMILAMLRRGGSSLRPALRPSRWLELVKQSIPAASLSISQTAVYRADRYLLGLMRSPRTVGIYSAASTGSEFLRLLPLAFSQFAFYDISTGRATRESFRKQRRMVLLACALIATGGVILAPQIVFVALGKSYATAASPFRLLLVANVANASYLVDTALLTAKGSIGSASFSTGAGLFILISLDLMLIPRFSEEGAAAAILVAYCVMAVLSRSFVGRAFRSGASPG